MELTILPFRATFPFSSIKMQRKIKPVTPDYSLNKEHFFYYISEHIQYIMNFN